jgi:hypothetical protein
MLKKATSTLRYTESVNRSWGDCRSDEAEVILMHIDPDEMDKLINKLTKQ